MYKYTSRPDLIDDMARLVKNRGNKVNFSSEYFTVLKIAGSFRACIGGFWKEYVGTNFFSTKKRKHISVCGYLVDRRWFVETKVD